MLACTLLPCLVHVLRCAAHPRLTSSLSPPCPLPRASAPYSCPRACSLAQLDQWLNILQSVQLPFALLPVLHFASSAKVMGAFRIHWLWRSFMWLLAVLVLVANVVLVLRFAVLDVDPDSGVPQTWWFYLLLIVFGVLYFAFVFYLMKTEIWAFVTWLRMRLCGYVPPYEALNGSSAAADAGEGVAGAGAGAEGGARAGEEDPDAQTDLLVAEERYEERQEQERLRRAQQQQQQEVEQESLHHYGVGDSVSSGLTSRKQPLLASSSSSSAGAGASSGVFYSALGDG